MGFSMEFWHWFWPKFEIVKTLEKVQPIQKIQIPAPDPIANSPQRNTRIATLTMLIAQDNLIIQNVLIKAS